MTNSDDSHDSTTNNSKNGPEQTRRSLLAAAGAVGVLGPAAALSIGKTAPEPKVAVDSPACNRVRVTNVGSVDVRIRIEGPNGVRVPEAGGLILAPAEGHTLNLASVDGVRGTYTVYDDEEDVVLGSIDHETCVTYYQVQFVSGPPKEALGRTPEDFYDREGRLIRYLHGSSEEPVTSGGRPGDDAVPAEAESCLTMKKGIQVDGDGAFITFTVHEGCELELSLASTLSPDGSFDRTERQTLFDSETRTVGPGRHRMRVNLPVSRE